MGLLPRKIDNTLYLLRKTRNSAVHAGADSVDAAKELISMTYNLATWFMKTYGDWAYEPYDFVMPPKTSYPDFEALITEQEKRIEELTKQLKAAVTTVSGTTQKERAKQSERVSAMMNWTEAQTRCLIDEQLQKAGWEADTKKLSYSKGIRPTKGKNIAISEWPTDSAYRKKGFVDYALFVGEKLFAVIEAKKVSEDVS